jgi:hypothetical protein
MNIIPPLHHTHLSPLREMGDSPDQAANDYAVGIFQLGASSVIPHFKTYKANK